MGKKESAAREFAPTAVTSFDEAVAKASSSVSERTINWFTVPEDIANETGVVRVGLVELTSGEELLASNRASNNAIRLAFELAKESVRFANNEEINTADGSADVFWGRTRPGMPKLRSLVLAAFGDIHNPSNAEIDSFLKSRSMKAG